MSMNKIGVIGAGTMGSGIAQVCALAGLPVTMVDISDAAIERGIATLDVSLDRLIRKAKLTVAQKGAALERVHGSTTRAPDRRQLGQRAWTSARAQTFSAPGRHRRRGGAARPRQLVPLICLALPV
jgi:3-hydroxyacyl-CoA dehydrogenase